jgi:hypothetical protein
VHSAMWLDAPCKFGNSIELIGIHGYPGNLYNLGNP